MDEIDKMMQNLASKSELNLAPHLTHAEFVQGVKDKKLEYTLIGEHSDFLSGGFKKANTIFKIMYLIPPLIIVPVFSYYWQNPWLLLGILFSYLGTFFAGSKIRLPEYALIYYIFKAIFGNFSFKSYEVVFYICVLWGYLWFLIAEQSQVDYANISLMANPDLYYLAVEKNRIIVTHKTV